MPRNPDPETKKQQAYVRGNTEEEKIKIKAVKDICARNAGLRVRDVILKGFDKFLKDHNWPPGDSQTVLEVYGVHKNFECSRCHGHFPRLERVLCISGLEVDTCQACKEELQRTTTFKKVLRTIE